MKNTITDTQALLNLNIDLLKIQQQNFLNQLIYSVKNYYYDASIHHLKNLDIVSKISLLKNPLELYFKYISIIVKSDISNVEYIEDVQIVLNKINKARILYKSNEPQISLGVLEYRRYMEYCENLRNEYETELEKMNKNGNPFSEDVPF